MVYLARRSASTTSIFARLNSLMIVNISRQAVANHKIRSETGSYQPQEITQAPLLFATGVQDIEQLRPHGGCICETIGLQNPSHSHT